MWMQMQNSEELLWQGQYLSMVKRGQWEYVKRMNISGIIGIVPLTKEDRIVLVEQYRPPLASRVIELPAGLVGDITGQEDESLEMAVQRELQEETGYVAGRLQRLCEGPSAPGMCSERLTLFLATDLKKVGEGGGDETESITVHEVATQEIAAWLAAKEREGADIDLKVYAGLFFLERNRG
ncbi:MAG: NUDIX hydrolase [Planctomycetes bacterium]|nr:NUDIX hydrolase [Planctomycetota bacterium]